MNERNELRVKQLEKSLDEFLMHGKPVPPALHGGIIRYITDGTGTGHFLTGVITNDLGMALAHGDFSSLEGLHATYSFFYNVAPHDCWGDKEKMEAWIEKGGESDAVTG